MNGNQPYYPNGAPGQYPPQQPQYQQPQYQQPQYPPQQYPPQMPQYQQPQYQPPQYQQPQYQQPQYPPQQPTYQQVNIYNGGVQPGYRVPLKTNKSLVKLIICVGGQEPDADLAVTAQESGPEIGILSGKNIHQAAVLKIIRHLKYFCIVNPRMSSPDAVFRLLADCCSRIFSSRLHILAVISSYSLLPSPIFSACSRQDFHSDSGVLLTK